MFVNWRRAGRVKAKHYKAWIEEADLMLKKQPRQHFPGDVKISLTFGPRDRRRDIDNLAKAPIDRLVSWNVIEDDSNIAWLSLAWDEGVVGCMAMVEPLFAGRPAA